MEYSNFIFQIHVILHIYAFGCTNGPPQHSSQLTLLEGSVKNYISPKVSPMLGDTNLCFCFFVLAKNQSSSGFLVDRTLVSSPVHSFSNLVHSFSNPENVSIQKNRRDVHISLNIAPRTNMHKTTYHQNWKQMHCCFLKHCPTSHIDQDIAVATIRGAETVSPGLENEYTWLETSVLTTKNRNCSGF
jgi:hypothetical protein